jgi:archaellum biogenesis ATPase FlaH
MSIGKEFLSACIKNHDVESFSAVPRDVYAESEAVLYDEVSSHLNTYQQLPNVPSKTSTSFKWYTSTTEGVKFYQDKLSIRFRAESAKTLAVDLVEDPTDEQAVSEALNTYHNRLLMVNEADMSLSSEQQIASYKQHLALIKAGGAISIGVDYLDEAMGGGVSPSDLFSLIGGSFSGKTYTFLAMAEAAARKKQKVLFVTLEMDIDQITPRRIALVKNWAVNLVADQIEDLGPEDLQSMLDSKLHILKMVPGASVALLEKHIWSCKPDIVFIDSAYKMSPMTKYRTDSENKTALVEDFKRIAMRCRVPVGISWQFNRSIGKLDSCAVDDFESYIAHTTSVYKESSLVMVLDPSEKYNERTGETLRLLHVIKNRASELPTARYYESRLGNPDSFVFKPVDEVKRQQLERRQTKAGRSNDGGF